MEEFSDSVFSSDIIQDLVLRPTADEIAFADELFDRDSQNPAVANKFLDEISELKKSGPLNSDQIKFIKRKYSERNDNELQVLGDIIPFEVRQVRSNISNITSGRKNMPPKIRKAGGGKRPYPGQLHKDR